MIIELLYQHLQAATCVVIVVEDDHLVVVPVRRRRLSELRGALLPDANMPDASPASGM